MAQTKTSAFKWIALLAGAVCLFGTGIIPPPEGLSQAVGTGLLGVGEADTEVRAVSKQALKVGQVVGGRNDQNVPDTRQHERGERIVDHRLVVDGQQLLARHGGERVEAGAGASGKDDALHAGPFVGQNWVDYS